MREITTTPVKNGEHVLVDGEKYVAEEAIGKMCSLCAFHNSYKCENIPCNGVIFKRVKKESHGRLIDADELLKKVREKADFPSEEWCKAIECIENAPTVLEASTSPSGFCNTEGCGNTKPDMSKAQNHICPYYQGVCSLDENILCYCEHHYEMCEKFIKVIKGKE